MHRLSTSDVLNCHLKPSETLVWSAESDRQRLAPSRCRCGALTTAGRRPDARWWRRGVPTSLARA